MEHDGKLQMTDRELVEYLDEGVKGHKKISMSVEFDSAVCSCGYNGTEQGFDYKEHGHPTPTLEWMLRALRKKGFLIKFAPFGTCKVVMCVIRKCHSDMLDITYEADNETLALRGAVEKMMGAE